MHRSWSMTADHPFSGSVISCADRPYGRGLGGREPVEPFCVAPQELVPKLGARSLITRLAVPMQSGQVESEWG